jgi:hypothetical protein
MSRASPLPRSGDRSKAELVMVIAKLRWLHDAPQKGGLAIDKSIKRNQSVAAAPGFARFRFFAVE